MKRNDFHIRILLQQVGRDVFVFTADAVHKIRAPQNHSLIDQLSERLVFGYLAPVEQEFLPETGVQQVANGMFGAADVHIHILPVGFGLFAHKTLGIVGVHVAEEVPA